KLGQDRRRANNYSKKFPRSRLQVSRKICTPKLTTGTSEGGAAMFRLEYKRTGVPCAVALASQADGYLWSFLHYHLLHHSISDSLSAMVITDVRPCSNIIAICDDFQRVFVVGPVFRAEDSYTHMHLCEFTGLDVEMEIKGHYSEVMDIVDSLFVDMFNKINEECGDAIRKQYPFNDLKYKEKTLKLTFEEGIQVLKVDPLGDLNTETERTLGKLVSEK
nr:aspartate--tRNA ligase 2, cytoplasmic-like [Tanacetum cinerariifolium]